MHPPLSSKNKFIKTPKQTLYQMKTDLIKQIRKKLTISHALFCVLYTTLSYVIFNALIFDKIVKWFYIKDGLDYAGLVAFMVIGFCAFIVVFALLAHRYTTKPLAIIFVIFSTATVYFSIKYNVVIDSSMVMNSIHTDRTEVHELLSMQMVPYLVFLIILPILAILLVKIKFTNPKKHLLSSAKLIAAALIIGIALIYIKFNSIQRVVNVSRKYIIYTVMPVNYIKGIGSAVQTYASPYFAGHEKKVEISGHIASEGNLVVVLAVGETSRQQNFSLYGYSRQNTNPVLSQDKNLHLLNGIARIGSTMYALPEILVKDGVPLPAITSKLGISTSCYVNYTLYKICNSVGEIPVSNCGHGGNCYDEDVLPLLSENLKSYKSGYRLIILHLGGGSHGPSYHERYPAEFQRFKPMCLDADVVNKCNIEELHNSYDNTILYVDHVVGKITDKLEKSKVPYVFIYLSDHGESLMEDGHIFHGMPPGVPLPKEQAQIPLIVKSSLPISIIKRAEYGQQDVYDTILGLFSIETNIRNKDKNFIKHTKQD